jgi:Transcription factor WhiB
VRCPRVASPETPRRSQAPQRWNVATSTDCTRAACHRCSADYCAHACHQRATKPDPLLVADREAWIGSAACIGQHVTVMFPERTSGQRTRPPGATVMEGRALRYCARSPVRRECAFDALAYETAAVDPVTGYRPRKPMPSGIAGGSTEQQRRELHRRDLTIQQKAEVLEWEFQTGVLPLILAPQERATACTGGSSEPRLGGWRTTGQRTNPAMSESLFSPSAALARSRTKKGMALGWELIGIDAMNQASRDEWARNAERLSPALMPLPTRWNRKPRP